MYSNRPVGWQQDGRFFFLTGGPYVLRGVCSAFVGRHAPHIVVVASAQWWEAACLFHVAHSFAHDNPCVTININKCAQPCIMLHLCMAQPVTFFPAHNTDNATHTACHYYINIPSMCYAHKRWARLSDERMYPTFQCLLKLATTCMYVYMYMHTCIYVRTCTLYATVSTYIHMHIHTYMYVHVRMYECMFSRCHDPFHNVAFTLQFKRRLCTRAVRWSPAPISDLMARATVWEKLLCSLQRTERGDTVTLLVWVKAYIQTSA